MTFREIKNKYGLDAEKLAEIFELKSAKSFTNSSANKRYKNIVVKLHKIFTEEESKCSN